MRSRVKPILVTGSNRSGTTWVGKMLAFSRHVFYVHEPFNPGAVPEDTLVDCPWSGQYHHVTAQEQESAVKYLEYRMGRYHPWLADVRSRPRPRRLVGASLRKCRSWIRRLGRKRPLLKDPIALMSAEWLQDTFDADVVVMVRHPAAYVSSIKYLDWPLDPGSFLRSEELVRACLSELVPEIKAYTEEGDHDRVEEAIMLWRIFHHVIAAYRERHPDWIFLRHEDLCMAPAREFGALYGALGLPFSDDLRRQIEAYSHASNPAESEQRPFAVSRDSRAVVRIWQKRLTHEETERVREGTQDIAGQFYSDEDW